MSSNNGYEQHLEVVRPKRPAEPSNQQLYKGHRTIIEQMIPFGNTIGGDIISWNAEVVIDDSVTGSREYEVVLLEHGADKVWTLAATFTSLIYDVCLTSRFGAIVRDKTWTPVLEFTPYGLLGKGPIDAAHSPIMCIPAARWCAF